MFPASCSADLKRRRRNALGLADEDAALEVVIFAFTHHNTQAIHRELLRGYWLAAEVAEGTADTGTRLCALRGEFISVIGRVSPGGLTGNTGHSLVLLKNHATDAT